MTHSDVLQVRDVHHWFGANRVLHDIELNVGRGQIVGLVGPSGCGKSTLLRAIVGTHPPKQGKIIVYNHHSPGHESEVCSPGRDRGIVYQHYSLFPFLTAQQNVAYGLKADETTFAFRTLQWPKWRMLRKEHMDKAAALLERVGLAKAMKLYPAEMSGGMRQRVAIAQALIMKPEVLLLDEPFGALDEAMRESLQRLLLGLYHENTQAKNQGIHIPHTIIIVTHELNEAIYVGDRIIGLSQFWNWRDAGHEAHPGATVVYDKPAPVFHPDDPRDYEQFRHMREEILKVVFNPESNHIPDLHRTFHKNPKYEGPPCNA